MKILNETNFADNYAFLIIKKDRFVENLRSATPHDFGFGQFTD
jgi:hypothetical protein